jgi:hypothetical protein
MNDFGEGLKFLEYRIHIGHDNSPFLEYQGFIGGGKQSGSRKWFVTWDKIKNYIKKCVLEHRLKT